jgi:hypothetical protein
MRSVITLTVLLATHAVWAADLELIGDVRFTGDIRAPENISAVARIGEGHFLAIGGDEGRLIQILRRVDDAHYTWDHNIKLADAEEGKEIDVEGLAWSEGRLYVMGSHSRKREKLDPQLSPGENRKLLEKNKAEPLREHLYELRLDTSAELTDKKPVSLKDRIHDDKVLKDFAKIPSKENGVDIEGVAALGDKIFAGFRGPVLREGLVPVLVFDFDRPNDAKTRFLNIGGRGIRDLVRVTGGFLLIGGPVGDEPYSYEVYFWDGENHLKSQPLVSLGRVPLPAPGSKAEGMTVLRDTETDYEVLIVFDGPVNGAPGRFRVKKS